MLTAVTSILFAHSTAEAGSLPRVHGSSIFARGETQALATATLAPADERQYFDNYAGGEDSKRFILHYSFPPFSVGEAGRFGGLNRREIGHGALAERSIEPVIPAEQDFPYAMRVTSEVLESNGSSSMATVCSGVMALLDAGVPLIRPVGAIAVGLVTEMDENDNIKEYKTCSTSSESRTSTATWTSKSVEPAKVYRLPA